MEIYAIIIISKNGKVKGLFKKNIYFLEIRYYHTSIKGTQRNTIK